MAPTAVIASRASRNRSVLWPASSTLSPGAMPCCWRRQVARAATRCNTWEAVRWESSQVKRALSGCLLATLLRYWHMCAIACKAEAQALMHELLEHGLLQPTRRIKPLQCFGQVKASLPSWVFIKQ